MRCRELSRQEDKTTTMNMSVAFYCMQLDTISHGEESDERGISTSLSAQPVSTNGRYMHRIILSLRYFLLGAQHAC